MPVSISSDITNNNYMQRLKLIQEAVSKVETSKIYDIPKINIIGEVDINKDNYMMNTPEIDQVKGILNNVIQKNQVTINIKNSTNGIKMILPQLFAWR